MRDLLKYSKLMVNFCQALVKESLGRLPLSASIPDSKDLCHPVATPLLTQDSISN